MLSRRIAVGLAVLAAAPAQAQTREQETRLDSLAAVAQRTRAAVEAYDDSVKRALHMLDTAYRGTPVVVAEASIVGTVRGVAPRVMDSIGSIIGPARSRLTGYALVGRVHHAASSGRRDTPPELLLSIVQPNGAELRGWRSPVDPGSIAASLAHAMTYAAFSISGPSFFAWAANALPGGPISESSWADQRLQLVSSRSAVGPRCYAGDLAACKSALLITPTTDPVMQWHDTATRRQMVRRNGAMARRIDGAATRQCEHGSDSSCIWLLRQFPASSHREPAPAGLRAAVLRHALAVGGDGAVARLLTAPEEPAARLEAAAGVPLDTLLIGWRKRVRETRVPSSDLSVGITLMALGWATGLGALSLRSSRWR